MRSAVTTAREWDLTVCRTRRVSRRGLSAALWARRDAASAARAEACALA